MLRLPAMLCCLAILGLVTACGDQARTPASPAVRTTVILGIDAWDWQVLDPLLAAGELPTLAALRARGTSGVNLSFVPLEKSPLIWASMATGLEPADHGVGGFLKGRGDEETTLASAADWQAPALWDIAGAAGLRSCVIGWWVTYPARPIAGVLVSDHVTYTDAGNRDYTGLVRPRELTAELTALTVDWRELPTDLLRLVLPDADEALLADTDHPALRDLRLALAGDLTYLATARHLAAREPFDLFAVYFRGFDIVCHNYWRFHRPAEGQTVSDRDRALFGQIIPGYARVVDRWLGELLPLFPDAANVMVVSDHGFHGARRDRAGNFRKGVAEHRPDGVLVIRSALYEPGSRFDRSFVLNVGPTALVLLGLPASTEMPGRVLREGLTAAGLAYVEHLEADRIASYAALAPQPPPAVENDPALEAAVKKQLRSLGYVD